MAGATGIVAAIAAAAMLGFFYLSQSSHVAATGYEIAGLEARLAELQADQQQLIYRIGEARSPTVIERAARGRLRLAPLPTDAVAFARPPADADAEDRPDRRSGSNRKTDTIDRSD